MEANDNFWWSKITRLIDMSRFKCFMSILISLNFNFSACVELLMCHVFDEYNFNAKYLTAQLGTACLLACLMSKLI